MASDGNAGDPVGRMIAMMAVAVCRKDDHRMVVEPETVDSTEDSNSTVGYNVMKINGC